MDSEQELFKSGPISVTYRRQEEMKLVVIQYSHTKQTAAVTMSFIVALPRSCSVQLLNSLKNFFICHLTVLGSLSALSILRLCLRVSCRLSSLPTHSRTPLRSSPKRLASALLDVSLAFLITWSLNCIWCIGFMSLRLLCLIGVFLPWLWSSF